MKTYHGSCHCGAVRFEADIDFSPGTIKCNCSVCSKMRFWAAQVPPAAFRLLEGGEALGEYRFGARRDGHHFCTRCGINLFSTGTARSGPFVAVAVASLDDAGVDEMMRGPVRYFDGRNDEWDVPSAEIRHL